MTDARIGHNIEAEYNHIATRLAADYDELVETVNSTVEAAEELPTTVEDSNDVARVSSHVVKLRDIRARTEAARKAEKEPHLRSGEVVDAFFYRLQGKVIDVSKALSARIDVFKQRQLAAERQRREAAAALARQQELEARRLREEAELAARRVRRPDAVARRAIEADAARVEEEMAKRATEEAELATQTKAAKLVSERFEGPERSGQVTMRQVPYVVIEDVARLDLEALRPHFKEEHLLMALKQWAKATGYNQAMPGAVVEMRDTTVVR